MVDFLCGDYQRSVQQRFVLTGILFIAIVSLYMMRMCLPISMTQMTKSIVTNVTVRQNQIACPLPAAEAIGSINKDTVADLHEMENMKFYWSHELQGFILSSFYIGYVIMHLPGGMIAERLGGKPVVLIGLICSTVLSLLTPFVATQWDAHGLIVIRILLGGVQAGMFPAVAALLAAWVPKIERGRIGSIIYCAGPFGAVIGNYVTGLLLHEYKNWHVGFYTFGFFGIMASLLFTAFVSSHPATHPFISDAEKAYLQKEIGQLKRDKDLKTAPWKSIFTSVPVIALVSSLVLGDWAYYIVLIDLPKYMNDVLHVSIKDNGLYTSLPWAMFIIVALISGALSDRLISKGRLSITNTRKLMVIISGGVDAIFLLAATYSGCDLTLVGLSFTIAVGAQGIIASSLILNPMDLSPNYAGTLSGIMGTFGCVMGIVVPIAVSQLTPNALQSEWRLVFWLTVIFQLLQLVIFTFCGSAKVQSWNNPATHKEGLQMAEQKNCTTTQMYINPSGTEIENSITQRYPIEVDNVEKKPKGQG